MAKNKTRSEKIAQPPARPAARFSGISKRGWKVIAAGAATAVVGYIVLSFTDPAGQNWASNLCPFLILGGYATIGVGIMTPDPGETENFNQR